MRSLVHGGTPDVEDGLQAAGHQPDGASLLLKRLLEQRERSPGEGLEVAELLAAGWPGERVSLKAGSSRVYNALTTLRQMGLEPILLRRNDGYLLDPDADIARVAERRRP